MVQVQHISFKDWNPIGRLENHAKRHMETAEIRQAV